jgi:DMSO reductase anchor subunit
MNETAASTPVARGHAGAFHEWPLVVFTTLAIMGAGVLTSPLVAGIVSNSTATAQPILLLGSVLLAAGLAVSLAHLGRPVRAPLAAARFGRSWLSTEVVLGGLTLGAGVLVTLRPYELPGVTLLTAVLAVSFLAALGLVYRLPGQQTWRGAVVFVPLTTGLGFGALALAGMWDGAVMAVGPVAAVLLAADTVLFVIRRFTLTWPRVPFTPRHPAMYEHRTLLLAARFALVAVIPGMMVLGGLPRGAAGSLGLGILLDRLMFYAFAAQHTTEAEIASVEERLGG